MKLSDSHTHGKEREIPTKETPHKSEPTKGQNEAPYNKQHDMEPNKDRG